MPAEPNASRPRRGWLVPAAVVAGLFALLGVWIALGGMRPPAPPTDEELTAAIADLGEKLEAAVVNGRDVTPLLAPAERWAQRRPDAAIAHRLVGQIRVERTEWPEAYAAFAQALSLDPSDAHLHRLAGGVAEQTQHWTQANQHYEAARELRPEDPALWVRLANVAVKEERYADAKPLLEAAIARRATLHEAQALLAGVLEHEGQPDEALAALEAAYNLAALEGGEPLRRYAVRLSEILRQRGELVKASKVLRLPTPEDAFHPDVMQPLGEVLLELDQPLAAAQYFEQWVQRDPTNGDAAAQAVAYYLEAQEASQARAMLVVLRRIDARHPRLAELESGLRTLRANADAAPPSATPVIQP
ncbi:MAG: tetratricopeptide repeat protein [Planctomycetota bacterium]